MTLRLFTLYQRKLPKSLAKLVFKTLLQTSTSYMEGKTAQTQVQGRCQEYSQGQMERKGNALQVSEAVADLVGALLACAPTTDQISLNS